MIDSETIEVAIGLVLGIAGGLLVGWSMTPPRHCNTRRNTERRERETTSRTDGTDAKAA